MSALPQLLRVHADGTLFCADGRNLNEYLAAWAKQAEVTEETPLNILRRDSYERDREDASLLRNFAS